MAKIEDLKEVRHDWWAPWRKPTSQLTLNEELVLDRLERAAKSGNIVPAPVEENTAFAFLDDGVPWYSYFQEEPDDLGDAKRDALSDMTPERRNNVALIRQSLN